MTARDDAIEAAWKAIPDDPEVEHMDVAASVVDAVEPIIRADERETFRMVRGIVNKIVARQAASEERERLLSGVRWWRRSVGEKSWSVECLTGRDAECSGCLCDCHVEAEVREHSAQYVLNRLGHCGDCAKVEAFEQHVDPSGVECDCAFRTVDGLFDELLGGCGCWTCDVAERGGRMFVCSVCGNKRCPKATDHRNACTGSNVVGQTGSRYRGDESNG